MRNLMRLAAVALALSILTLAAFGPTRRIDYTLTPVLEHGALSAIQVDLTFRGADSGQTNLILPSSWGGQDELWRGVDALDVVSGATLQNTDSPSRRVLTHRPNAPIHIRYRVIQDWQGAPRAERGNEYRNVIQPAYFHIIGNAAIVAPDLDDNTPARLRIAHLPRGWSFASDLEHPRLTLAALNQSVAVGGDFRILRGGDPNIRVAVRGQYNFTDAAFTAEASRIITGERQFWNDRSAPYLVTLLPIAAPDPGWLSVGGTGLDDAFAFFATSSAPAAIITRTLAHEGLHTWIPAQIGGMPQENEAADYWLSEGFTDFYTGRVLVRSGEWTPAQFAADLNGMLRAYAQSPVRVEPNSRVIADFWHDRDVQKLPYQRGRMLASLWDTRLRAHGRGLDDVMRAMRERAGHGDVRHAVDLFVAIMLELGVDARPDIAAYVERGEAIELPADAFGACGRIETTDAPVFDRGYDLAATEANHNVITGVDPSLPAYAAGLRDGMTLIRRDGGEIGNADVELAYVVRDADRERVIRYLPRGRGAYRLQRLVLDSGLSGERLAQCVRVLAG